MEKFLKLFAGLSTYFLLHTQAFALGAILHIQGEDGDREAYFADVTVITNRTPPSLMMPTTEIKEIPITAVYENANKPEWVFMNLQFECPASVLIDYKKGDAKDNPLKIKAGDNVKFRIGAGSYKLRRADLKSEPLPESDWKNSNAPMLSKAAAIACNDLEFNKTVRRAASKNSFNSDQFGKEIYSKFNLPADMMLIGQVLSNEFLDYTWTILWWEKVFEGKRPNPSGKWTQKASEADKKAAMKKLQDDYDQIKPQVEAAKKSLQEGIHKMDAEFEFQDKAAKLRQGRQLNRFEVHLNAVWVGKLEQEVVNKMGNPELNSVGDTRFLNYTKYFDNRGYAIHMGSGAVVSEGIYMECYAEFSTMQDKNGEWRVADVKVRAIGGADLCYDISRIPD